MTRKLVSVPKPKKRVVIYARVSRDDTGEGRSTQRQILSCRQLAELRGWEVVAVREDISIGAYDGKERPAWTETLKLVANGEVDIILSWHLDRITRSTAELEELILFAEHHGIGIATVTGDIDLTTDVGQMVARILAAVARAEVQRKAARQRLAYEQRRKEGLPSHAGGVRPFGYADDHLTVVPKEAKAIREAARDALRGISLATIAKRWTEAGLVSSRSTIARKDGKKPTTGWTPVGVKGVLVNPRHAGMVTYMGVESGVGDWEAILDRETHLALKLKLEDPSRNRGTNKKGRTPTTLQTGITRCSVCDRTVKGAAPKGRRTYTCPDGHVATDRDQADQWVHANMIATLESPAILKVLVPSEVEGVDGARAEHSELLERLDTLGRMFARGKLSEAQLDAGTEEIREQLTELEQVLASAAGGGLLDGLDVGTELVADQWLALPLERQRVILDALMTIELVPTGRGRGSIDRVPIGEQVRVLDKVP